MVERRTLRRQYLSFKASTWLLLLWENTCVYDGTNSIEARVPLLLTSFNWSPPLVGGAPFALLRRNPFQIKRVIVVSITLRYLRSSVQYYFDLFWCCTSSIDELLTLNFLLFVSTYMHRVQTCSSAPVLYRGY